MFKTCFYLPSMHRCKSTLSPYLFFSFLKLAFPTSLSPWKLGQHSTLWCSSGLGLLGEGLELESELQSPVQNSPIPSFSLSLLIVPYKHPPLEGNREWNKNPGNLVDVSDSGMPWENGYLLDGTQTIFNNFCYILEGSWSIVSPSHGDRNGHISIHLTYSCW